MIKSPESHQANQILNLIEKYSDFKISIKKVNKMISKNSLVYVIDGHIIGFIYKSSKGNVKINIQSNQYPDLNIASELYLAMQD